MRLARRASHVLGLACGAALIGAARAQDAETPAQAVETGPAARDSAGQGELERDVLAPALFGLTLLDQHGKPEDVVLAFEHYPPEVQADPRAVLMYAAALAKLGRGEDARAAMRAALASHPDHARLRAELGRSLFEARRDDAARVQFELALGAAPEAGPLRDAERAAVRQYLAAIDQRRAWRWRGSFAIAPDTNIYAATSAEEVELFGLPFRLDESSRKASGVGVDYSLGGAGRFGTLGFARGHWRVDVDVSGVEYEDALFDQTRAAVQAGPRMLAGDYAQFGFDALAERRWRGGAEYSVGYGLEANVLARPAERWSLYSALSLREVDEEAGDRRDGLLASLDFSAARRGAPDRSLSARLYLQRGDLEAESERYWYGYASLGAYRELPGAIGLFVEPFVSYRRNDADDPLFLTLREDEEYGVRIRASKRDWTVFDSAPFVSLLASRRTSTIPLYDDADRVRAEFGFTRAF